jgi:hypothetical protein
MSEILPPWERKDNFRSYFYEILHEQAQELDALRNELENRLDSGFAHFEDTFHPVVLPGENSYTPPNTPSREERLTLAWQRSCLWIALLDVYGAENIWLGPSLILEAGNGLTPEELRAFYVKGLPTTDDYLEAPTKANTPLAFTR